MFGSEVRHDKIELRQHFGQTQACNVLHSLEIVGNKLAMQLLQSPPSIPPHDRAYSLSKYHLERVTRAEELRTSSLAKCNVLNRAAACVEFDNAHLSVACWISNSNPTHLCLCHRHKYSTWQLGLTHGCPLILTSSSLFRDHVLQRISRHQRA